jgi:hypothetical protein
MKIFALLFTVFVLAISCKNSNTTEVTRTISDFETLNEEILTSFPGGIYVLDNNIVWFNPFTSKNFLHCLDKESGNEIGTFGSIGQGPNEFISPLVSDIIWNNSLYVYDANGRSRGYFSVDRFKNGLVPFTNLSTEDSLIRAKGYDMRLGSNLYIGLNSSGENNPYKLYNNGKETTFGEYLLPEIKSHFGSTILFNPDRNLLVTGSFSVNYFSCYKKDNDNFNLIWERREGYDYNMQDGHVVFDRSRRGIYGMALTKDFIVTIQRDYQNDNTNEAEVGRNLEKLPRTLFVYDYEGSLLEIINYQVPIGRIAGDLETNMIYAIYADPDFMLGVTTILSR